MLKIKDGVNLRKLVQGIRKEYGYQIKEERDYFLLTIHEPGYGHPYFDEETGECKEEDEWQIWKDNKDPEKHRLVRLLGSEYTKPTEDPCVWTNWSFTDFDMMYDLIKLGFAEKV